MERPGLGQRWWEVLQSAHTCGSVSGSAWAKGSAVEQSPGGCQRASFHSPGQVLELLKVAWKRRLIFTVGTSSTTGETDTVVWNEIHHKTEMDRNLTGHGYPDPNYLQNVLAELAAQGVTEDCLGQQ